MPLQASREIFGKRVRDTESGFIGVATGFGCYRSSGDQVCMQGRTDTGEPVTHWAPAEVCEEVTVPQ